MTTYDTLQTVSRIAGSALTIFRFVALSAADGKYDHVGVAQARIDGICGENTPTDGDVFQMIIPTGGMAIVEAGAAVAIGDIVGSDNVGRAITAVSGVGNGTAGVAQTAAGAAGETIQIQFIVDRDQA